ncbi:hypothetical protein BGX27_004164 [Mortierella sp. AM989]|nr:hypothetical protein BGX27_004164 [Mortierella sp. AM989]
MTPHHRRILRAHPRTGSLIVEHKQAPLSRNMDNYDGINNSNGNLPHADQIDVLMPNDNDPIEDAFRHEDPHYRRSSYRQEDGLHDSRDNRESRNRGDSRRESRGRSRSPERSRDYHERGNNGSRHHDRDEKYNSDHRRSSHHESDRGGRIKPRSKSPTRLNSISSVRDRRVYVGNLSYDVKWTDLKDFMREIGPVAHADVLLSSDGRSKGCGVVEFHNAEDAKEAIRKLNDIVLMGRPVFVREDRESDARIGFSGGRGSGLPSRHGGHGGHSGHIGHIGHSGHSGSSDSGTRQIYIANLPYSVNWKDLKDMFRRAGPVDRADVFMTNDGRSKGSGTVSFDRPTDVSRAVSMFNGFEWHGRRIEVREDKYGPPAGGPNRGPSSRHESSRYEPSRGGSYNDSYSHGDGGNSDYKHDSSSRQHDLYDGSSARSHHSNTYADMSMESVPSGPAAGSGDQIYIRNLPFTTTEQDLKDLFRTCGPIRTTEIILSNGRPKGSGIVRFELFESADKAVAKFNGYIYGGRPLEIKYDHA